MPSPAETIGDRIRQIRGSLSQVEFAAILKADKNTIGRYERDERQPDGNFLLRLYSSFQISIDWLLTGNGPMRTEGCVQPALMDEDLMVQIGDGISNIYRDENTSIAPSQLIRLASRIYSDLASFPPQEKSAGLKGVLGQLRRDLRDPPTENCPLDENSSSTPS